MCGTIAYENTSHKIGNLVAYQDEDRILRAPWLGHARQESPRPANSKLVKLIAETYTEKGVEFQVPQGKQVEAYLVKNSNFPKGEGLFVITRDATPEELKRCPHPRHPRFTQE